jgi:uncharacterized protein YecT (DUF1311 family)
MFAKTLFLVVATCICASVGVLAGAAGSPSKAKNRTIIERCLADKIKMGEELSRCIGIIADPCLEKSEDPSTYGMANCSTREYDVWDVRLNENYQKLMKDFEGEVKASLREIERVWMVYRDKKCGFYHVLERGTAAIPMDAYCTMTETGR